MRFLLSWLKEYIDVDLSSEQIAKALTSAGLEVDEVSPMPASADNSSSETNDYLFEVSLTPNLGHCSSLLGIARELSASLNKPYRFSNSQVLETNIPIEELVKVEIKDSQKCPRYACRLVQGVKVAESPEWMKNRLLACGIRPVNNIVDITNYVLLEFGQPLHAFDFDKLQEGALVVRSANPGELFTTLDGKEKALEAEDLLICDAVKPVALAGIMGGQNSEVDTETKNVLIESAHFSPATIRRSSKRLGLQTDASKRFERHVDPDGVVRALNRAAELMHELAEGQINKGLIDVKKEVFLPHSVCCRLSRINELLGTQLSLSEVENIFQRLDFKVYFDGKDIFNLKVPSYRADVKQEVDIIEEVARIYGYENFSLKSPHYQISQLAHAPIYLFENQVRARLLSEGLQELLTCDLIGPSLLNIAQEASMPEEAAIRVLNPTSIEQSILRTSLLPGLMGVVKNNYAHQMVDLSGFEIGRIHFKDKESYKEQSVVGLIMTGKNRPHHWEAKAKDVDFYDLKGTIESLLDLMNVKNYIFKKNRLTSFHPGRQLAIYVDSLEIGSFGEVHPKIIKRLDISQRIYFAEINLHDLYKVQSKQDKVVPLAIFPSSSRDLTLPLSKNISAYEVIEEIKGRAQGILEEVILLDVYENASLGKETCNVTYRFIYRDKEKTLEQGAVDQEHWRLVDHINQWVAKR